MSFPLGTLSGPAGHPQAPALYKSHPRPRLPLLSHSVLVFTLYWLRQLIHQTRIEALATGCVLPPGRSRSAALVFHITFHHGENGERRFSGPLILRDLWVHDDPRLRVGRGRFFSMFFVRPGLRYGKCPSTLRKRKSKSCLRGCCITHERGITPVCQGLEVALESDSVDRGTRKPGCVVGREIKPEG